MFNRLLIVVAVFCFLQSACVADPAEPISITMVDLLASIEDYSGKEVSVVGFFAAHANLTLFESQAHEETRDYLSSLVVGDYDHMELHRSDCLDKVVEITGEITSGAAKNFILGGVKRITLVSTNIVCWQL